MKIWFGYGSEHSANLVMIGRFTSEVEAERAKRVIDQIMGQVNSDQEHGSMKIGHGPDRFSDDMLNLLHQLKIYSMSPTELDQFSYDFTITLEGDEVKLKTDEIDVSAFLKVFIDMGARVEVFSAHDRSAIK